MDNFIYAYYQGIRDGSICVGRWIRLLYEKIVTGIEDGAWIFDQKKANKAILFIERYVRHNKGPLAPGPLKLELWEKALISLIFGIVDNNNFRVFKEVAIIVGRKCGKTLLASAIMAYAAYVDGDFGSEIYAVAPKLDQADLVYSAWEFTMQQNPELAKRTKKRKTDYYIPSTNTIIKKLPFTEKSSDGMNPMVVVADETSSWPADRGLKMWEVMLSGTISRNEPIIVSISSGGYVDEGIFDELMKRGTRWLLGDSKEKHLLPIFYIIDDINKWDDINELRKSLPGLGVSIRVQTILDEIVIANESLSKKKEFICKYCNLKQNSSSAWLDSSLIERASGKHFGPEDFRGSYCVGGIDLSMSRDLTAAVVLIEREGQIYILAKFWLPRERLQEAIQRDGLPYDLYVQRGILELSGDNYVDYEDCYRWFVSLVEQYEILPLKLGYDRYCAQYLVKALEAYGFHIAGNDVFQGDNLYFPAMQPFLGLLEDDKIRIGDNDLLKVHLLNAAVKMSIERGRGKLVKINPAAHIDGCAAIMDAMVMRDKYAEEISDQLRNEG